MLLLTGCGTVAGVKCPKLAAPPASVVDALEGAARKDGAAAAYVIDLNKHYDKLEVCR